MRLVQLFFFFFGNRRHCCIISYGVALPRERRRLYKYSTTTVSNKLCVLCFTIFTNKFFFDFKIKNPKSN